MFLFVEGVIEGEGMVVDVFGDSIDFKLGLMHFYLRVGAGDRIDLPSYFFFLEDGPFPHANSQLTYYISTLFSELKT